MFFVSSKLGSKVGLTYITFVSGASSKDASASEDIHSLSQKPNKGHLVVLHFIPKFIYDKFISEVIQRSTNDMLFCRPSLH